MTAPMLILAGKTFSRGAIAELRPWTDEEIERLRELRARGLSRADCGEKLGRSEGAVAGILRTNRYKAGKPIRHRTPEREVILRRDWPGGVQVWDIIARMNALPGAQITDPNTVSVWASALEIKRPEGFIVSRLYLGAWTPARDALLTELRAAGRSDAETFAAINATPGEPLANEKSIRRRVKTLGLPPRPKKAPAPQKPRPSRAKPEHLLKRNRNGMGRKARPVKTVETAPKCVMEPAAPVQPLAPRLGGLHEAARWYRDLTGKTCWELKPINDYARKHGFPVWSLLPGKIQGIAGRRI